MNKNHEIQDYPRTLVHKQEQLPFMTIIIIRGADTYYAWQPEYNIQTTGKTMEETILFVAAAMGSMISDPDYDYIHEEEDGNIFYDVPVPMLPEDYAIDLDGLAESMEELFNTEVSRDDLFFASATPRL